MGSRWSTVPVVVAGPSGNERRVEAGECEPDADADSSVIVPTLIVAMLLTTGFLFPPCLLFNIPILLFRAAISQASRASYDRLRLGTFDCPECGNAQPASELAGALPLQTACVACKASLAVRRGPRRNHVDEPPPA